MGSFFSALVGSYAQGTMQKKQVEQAREDAAKKAEINALGLAMDNPNFNPDMLEPVTDRIIELSGTKGGAKGKGGGNALKSVLTKLRGQIPKDQQYQPQSLAQTVAGGGAGDAKPATGAAATPGAQPGAAQPSQGQGAFLTPEQMEARSAALAKKKAIDDVDINTEVYKKINQAASQFTDPEARRSFLFTMKALPPDQKPKVTFKAGLDPTSGRQIMHVFDENGSEISSYDMGLPTTAKPQKTAVQLPDGTVTEGWENPGGVLTDAEYGGKPLPAGSKKLAASGYYPTAPTSSTSTVTGPDGVTQQTNVSRAGGGKVLPGGQGTRPRVATGAGGSSPTKWAPSKQLMTNFNQSMTRFKTEESQANTALNQAKSQKSSHPIYSAAGMLGTNVKAAQRRYDNAQRATAYLQSQKEVVLAGKADPQEVSNKAQAILDGHVANGHAYAVQGGSYVDIGPVQ
jgi:hypothetical protein